MNEPAIGADEDARLIRHPLTVCLKTAALGISWQVKGSIPRAEFERQMQDEKRTRSIAEHGYRVLRFWDDEVLKDVEIVIEQIWAEIVS